jgi:hypothetical protein
MQTLQSTVQNSALHGRLHDLLEMISGNSISHSPWEILLLMASLVTLFFRTNPKRRGSK